MRRAEWVIGLVLAGCATGGGSAPSGPDRPDSEPAREPEPEVAGEGVAEPQGEADVASPTSQAPAEKTSTVAPPMVVETITGIPDCDAYLELYARCEGFLRPEIMAGDRRAYATEKAALLHFAESPEAPELPGACAGMLDALQRDCPEQERAATAGR